ncbi:hypothetical protein [Aurantiacibacter luteus]|uniref:asparagine synthase (glutamine-hydrolyzing) n=1 Tax=Aurantiacibacter luteus TaxID=1581420 RepID=A0A0G9MYC1_9SPHN|nr:hypothetical protein [Aurantiacibacter luteus]KLE35685.1 hypothetical protein AAW00_04620 [Aurantiacibacter luteus]
MSVTLLATRARAYHVRNHGHRCAVHKGGAGGKGFGHARIATIDLTGGVAHHISAENRRYDVTFTGEVYSYRDLRSELKTEGAFRSDSDAKALLLLLTERGPDMVTALVGMLASFL